MQRERIPPSWARVEIAPVATMSASRRRARYTLVLPLPFAPVTTLSGMSPSTTCCNERWLSTAIVRRMAATLAGRQPPETLSSAASSSRRNASDRSRESSQPSGREGRLGVPARPRCPSAPAPG